MTEYEHAIQTYEQATAKLKATRRPICIGRRRRRLHAQAEVIAAWQHVVRAQATR